jgi:hypothetical protein
VKKSSRAIIDDGLAHSDVDCSQLVIRPRESGLVLAPLLGELEGREPAEG